MQMQTFAWVDATLIHNNQGVDKDWNQDSDINPCYKRLHGQT